jgi:putative transposase
MGDWPHAPVHRLGEAGAYIVTAGTYKKEHYFQQSSRLSFLHDSLIRLATEYGWALQAWAVFSNHYHFVAMSPGDPGTLRLWTSQLHTLTAREANRLDKTPGRKVWFQFWETHLTYERSYLARLNYVLQNPVRHGLVRVARDYPWCSAAWFEQRSGWTFFKTVTSFKIDRVKVPDNF